ncbi:MAG: hypothetical protein JWR33_722 [Naasia sp.]|uniref:WecB/TagA/CpsF family glycosyltransferase n=1 Tax=Naasia sp. TaxID=2546198 RepID=UPI00263557DA|nr:WecB/TagA/CpsF family glycosyltransferase [Naasia sp.]MCU1569981.1 hypothetical protein [Naasia sp.]
MTLKNLEVLEGAADAGTRIPLQVRDGRAYLLGHEMFADSPFVLLNEIERLLVTDEPHLVVTANVDQALNLRRDPVLDRAYSIASLRLIDGQPLVAALRLLGMPSVFRNTGADLIDDVARSAGARNWRIAVFGGGAGTAERAAAALADRARNSVIEGFAFPFVSSARDPRAKAVVSELAAFRPDIVFMCLGSPKQEEWYLEWRDQLPPGVYVGAGAAVDFAAGRRVRAPRWVQKLGAEWTWRLAQEPRRLASRYLVKGPGFLGLLATSLVASLR